MPSIRRLKGESVAIGNSIVTVSQINQGAVILDVRAHKLIPIARGESADYERISSILRNDAALRIYNELNFPKRATIESLTDEDRQFVLQLVDAGIGRYLTELNN